MRGIFFVVLSWFSLVDTSLCNRCPHETKLYSKFYILFQILSRPDKHYFHHPRYLHPGSRDFSPGISRKSSAPGTPRTVQDGEGNGASPGSGVPELFRLMPGEPGMLPRTIPGSRGYSRSCTVPGTAVSRHLHGLHQDRWAMAVMISAAEENPLFVSFSPGRSPAISSFTVPAMAL